MVKFRILFLWSFALAMLSIAALHTVGDGALDDPFGLRALALDFRGSLDRTMQGRLYIAGLDKTLAAAPFVLGWFSILAYADVRAQANAKLSARLTLRLTLGALLAIMFLHGAQFALSTLFASLIFAVLEILKIQLSWLLGSELVGLVGVERCLLMMFLGTAMLRTEVRILPGFKDA